MVKISTELKKLASRKCFSKRFENGKKHHEIMNLISYIHYTYLLSYSKFCFDPRAHEEEEGRGICVL